MESGSLRVNTFVAKDLVFRLNEATELTEHMYGMDLDITYRILKNVLRYENRQSGLNLTHTQDRSYIQVMLAIR